ncbi:MAG TPA: hypothetical protein VH306_14250 [Gaiellaceae bacterium]|jgi:hypothetical protein
MTAIIIVLVVAAIVAAILAAIGAGVLVLVIIPIAIFVIGWFVLVGLSRTRTTEIVRNEPQQELLGPGGPDDPNR